jgi:hypothetical protein
VDALSQNNIVTLATSPEIAIFYFANFALTLSKLTLAPDKNQAVNRTGT